MHLIVTDKGDESVGIFAQTWEVPCPFERDEVEKDSLFWFKRQMIDTFGQFANGRLVADYDFELGSNEFVETEQE